MIRTPIFDDLVDEEREWFDSASYEAILERLGLTELQHENMQAFLQGHPWTTKGYGDVESAIRAFEAGEPDPEPVYGRIVGGGALFYAGEVNSLFGPHSAAKSWLMLLTVKQALESGESVLYLDFEDTTKKAVKRLLQVGTDPALIRKHLHHAHPPTGVGKPEQMWLDAVIRLNQVKLCVIDTVGIALGIEAKDSNHDSEVSQWLAMFPTFIADQGVCVVLVDHLAKTAFDKKNPGGSGRKLQSVSGAAFSSQAKQAFGKGRRGEAEITCQKDRNGFYFIDQKVATFVLDALTGPLTAALVAIEPPPATIEEALGRAAATVQAVVNQIDLLGVPRHAGFTTVRPRIDRSVTNEALREALRVRKMSV